ncbi:HK97 family phage major capsid protein/HK97 family phage prohead protease [Rhizobium sp. SG_E_25_P2]|uniref:phage major capsid protein n=1 Tax=Rhizobium sp. SG_E_25_P2 TaxID=2879942 RepID=UPI00247416C6|nr:phage major capsid protein [Rhizobium sp. SG_E_25_P2]MDH6268263.1 HK97 family phage major capsid protein/HK97 family phage prohead protease [Rhizobium sp. SG_E_25_P2]
MSDTENLEIKAEISIDDAGTVTGLAWPFGAPDSVGDVIEKGAFGYANTMPMLMEHEQGKGAIGVWESFAETDKGLEVKGRLFLEGVSPARDAHRALKLGTITGLSIGFRHNGFEERPEGGRVFKSITVNEISLCRRPVHPGARVTVVKSLIEEPKMHTEEMKNEPETKSDPVISVEEFKAVKARLDAVEAKSNRLRGANNNQPAGDNENGEIKKAFEGFLRHGVERISPELQKALTVSVDANGGYLAPEAFGDEILKKIVEFSPIRQYAKVTTISASEVKYPRKLTGSAATWVSEIGARTESGMTFEQATFTPYEMSTFVPVSRQLLEDNAYGLEAELVADFGESFAKAEGAAFTNGDGVGKPKGLLTASGITEVKTGNAATLGTDPAATIIGMFHSVPSVIAQNGVWIMNRKTLGALRTLKDGTGRFIMLDPITTGAPATLLGRPIVEAIDMPDVAANAFPILFGDLSGYRIVDRIGLSILRDPYTLSGTGQVKFTAYKRTGGDVSHADRFIKLKVAA